MEYEEKSDSQPGSRNVGHEIRHELIELAKMVGLFLVLFWGLKTFVIEGYEVQGPSMTPTLEEHERILVFKLPHELSKLPLFRKMEAIQAKDIVVFESSVEAKKRYIKRVVAKGPASALRNNTANAHSRESGEADVERVQVIYAGGRIYVNNRLLDEEYLPPEEMRSPDRDRVYLLPGQYYVMGDHRSVSKDSRSFGPVDTGQIIGKAVFRIWPLSKMGWL